MIDWYETYYLLTVGVHFINTSMFLNWMTSWSFVKFIAALEITAVIGRKSPLVIMMIGRNFFPSNLKASYFFPASFFVSLPCLFRITLLHRAQQIIFKPWTSTYSTNSYPVRERTLEIIFLYVTDNHQSTKKYINMFLFWCNKPQEKLTDNIVHRAFCTVSWEVQIKTRFYDHGNVIFWYK